MALWRFTKKELIQMLEEARARIAALEAGHSSVIDPHRQEAGGCPAGRVWTGTLHAAASSGKREHHDWEPMKEDRKRLICKRCEKAWGDSIRGEPCPGHPEPSAASLEEIPEITDFSKAVRIHPKKPPE